MTTIQQVAVAAGVSPATVSRVLNGGGTNVSAEKTERVRRAIAEVGWRPNGPARSLRRRTANVWAAIVPDIENPYLTALVRGVEDVAQSEGFSMILCNSDDDPSKERRYLEIAVAELMSGVVIAPASYRSTDFAPLHRAGIPVVCVVRRHADPAVDGVFTDDRRGAALATAHLIDQGARRPACITGPPDTSTAAERLEGFLDAVRAAGIGPYEQLVRHADFRYDGGYDAAVSLLTLPEATRPDAILATNNLMGVAALDACAERGIGVPAEVRLACFDEVPWGRYLRPRLTVVTQPAHAVGEAAGRLMLERQGRPDAPAREVIFAPELTVHGSSITSPA